MRSERRAVCAATIAFATSCVFGCLGNVPYQVPVPAMPPATAGAGCDDSYQRDPNAGYELGFVEFTERGNAFRRDCMDHVLGRIRERARAGNAAVIVFVHGWRHNAQDLRPDRDQNVHCFKQLLASFSRAQGSDWVEDIASETCFENQYGPAARVAGPVPPAKATGSGVLYDKETVIGVYVGWRGLPYRGGPAELATYWDRKSVAEEVGRGGVTELLLRLEDIVWRPDGRPSSADYSPKSLNAADGRRGNVFVVIGHSFGGAIVLSALDDVLMERVVGAQTDDPANCPSGAECVVTRPFGHAMVLLNPAIEANQALQLKEMTSSRRFSSEQSRLLHVISTEADFATHAAFPVGQSIGVTLTWRQTALWRERRPGDWIRLREADLDTQTVGNFAAFRTGYLDASPSSRKERPRWCYRNCVPLAYGARDVPASHACVDPDETDTHFPVRPFEPLAFVYTDETFMSGHNDVFNPRVRAYLAAIVAESLRRRGELPAGLSECAREDFESCFRYFLGREADYLRDAGWDPTALGGYADPAECAGSGD